MKFKLYNEVKEFYKDTYDVLLKHEAQNIIPLGNIIIGYKGEDKTDWRDPKNWFMATIFDESSLHITAIMTPPHLLTLYATDNKINDEALDFLVSSLVDSNIYIPGVMSEKNLAEKFAQKYTDKKGLKFEIYKNQRIYELVEVNPKIPSVGNLRLANESDMSFFPYWAEAFNSDCFEMPIIIKDDLESYHYHISQNRLYILEDSGMPVSMARIGRDLVETCVVNYVYTPPYLRGKGYASSCVAKISQIGLERGFKKCVLYTDLSNPTSNSIYQKIGYVPICDSSDIRFS